MAKEIKVLVPPDVAVAFSAFPEAYRTKLMYLRRLILETATEMEGVGEIEETLKWGEPSYLTPKTKSGSTVRIAWKESNKYHYSIFFKCTANLIPAFREKYPNTFSYGGDRSLDFGLEDDIPVKELKQCIALALTYHRNKNLKAPERWRTVENI